MMNITCVNLACGDVFIDSPNWLNFDFSPINSLVTKANLLETLPLSDNSVDVIYTSHFIEHIPYDDVPIFLNECFRILKPGGIIRIVTPDFVAMCREYINQYDSNNLDKAFFSSVSIIDQCVRKVSGGQLARLYDRHKNTKECDQLMIDYIKNRTGEDLLASHENNILYSVVTNHSNIQNSFIKKLLIYIKHKYVLLITHFNSLWFQFLINQLPMAFRKQNLSLASVGELHQWLWDSHQLSSKLIDCGFNTPKSFTFLTSQIPDFPFSPLDTINYLSPRKGFESMYIEAVK